MASSLILGRFDLLDPASPVFLSTLDRGHAVPTVSEVQSTVLDGAVVTGDGAGNRSPVLNVVVTGDRLTMIGLTNEVLKVVNSASWTLTFTPDGGAPVVYDCFRATAEFTSDLLQERSGSTTFTVTCEALPFGRSPTSVSFDLVSTGVVVDAFSTEPTVTGASSASISATGGVGGGPALMVTPNFTGPNSDDFTVSRSGLSVSAPSGVQSATIQVDTPLGYEGAKQLYPNDPWALTLTTSTGTYTASISSSVNYDLFSPVTVSFDPPIPASTITGYSFAFPSFYSGYGTFQTAAIDSLQITAAAGALVSSVNGSQLMIPSVIGTARAPAGVQLARTDSSAFSAWCVHTPPAGATCQALIPVNHAIQSAFTTSVPATYSGTYSAWVAVEVPNSSDSTRSAYVTFSQSADATDSARFTYVIPANASGSTVYSLQYLGDVTLPFRAVPDGSDATIDVLCSAQTTGATLLDILLLDTRGRTILVDSTAPAHLEAWIDEPATGNLFGDVYSGDTRQSASSVQSSMPAGASLVLNPGESNIMLYGVDGPLAATLTYSPRWLQDADWPTS